MRNVIAWLLCLLLVGLFLPAGAVTLPELRAEAPDRLTMTIEGPDGPVSIDAPVILPTGEALPIMKAQMRRLDTQTVYQTFPACAPTEDSYWYPHYLEDRVAPLFLYPRDLESERFVPDKYGGNAGAMRVYRLGGQPDNNALPREAPEDFLRQVLALAGAADAEVRLSGQMAVSRPYQKKTVRTQDDEAPILLTADLEHPIASTDRGYWTAGFSQYLDGIRVFAEGYQAVAPTKYGAAPSSPYGSLIRVEMVSPEDYDLTLGLLETGEVLEASPTLASFADLRQAIVERIRAGQLLDVREIELGYMLFWETSPEGRPEEEWQPGMGRYVLSPVWRVTGYDVKDRGSFKFYRQGEDPRLPDDVDYAYAATLFGAYQVRVDARTGAFVEDETYVWTP